MHIGIVWHTSGKYPSFNVQLSSKEGADPFLEVKGCKIMHGTKGEWVSWPSTKNEKTGKYWNHCYASEKFNEAVMAEAKKTMPKEEKPQRNSQGSMADMEDDVPFSPIYKKLP